MCFLESDVLRWIKDSSIHRVHFVSSITFHSNSQKIVSSQTDQQFIFRSCLKPNSSEKHNGSEQQARHRCCLFAPRNRRRHNTIHSCANALPDTSTRSRWMNTRLPSLVSCQHATKQESLAYNDEHSEDLLEKLTILSNDPLDYGRDMGTEKRKYARELLSHTELNPQDVCE